MNHIESKWRSCISRPELFVYLGFAFIVIGAKFWLIAHFANATPYWDQWDSEADFLYRPYLDGTLRLNDLFAVHNEHRILLTRLLGITLLELNDQIWDPILQMQVNACLHVLAILTLLHLIKKNLSDNNRHILFLFSAILVSIPYGWENTLAGFQSQFYFLLFFSFVFLWSISCFKLFTFTWWIGFFCGILSVFSLASGAITLMAGMLLLIIRSVFEWPPKKSLIPGISVLLLAIIIAVVLTPQVPAHAPLKAQDLLDFLIGLALAMSWPSHPALLLVMQMPLAIFMFLFLKGRLERSSSNWFIFALGLWFLGQLTALAYGRSVGTLSSRYLDIFSIGLIINLVCIFFLYKHSVFPNKKTYTYVLGIWLFTLVVSAAFYLQPTTHGIKERMQQGMIQEQNVRAYLNSRDPGHLADKPFLHIPYPHATRLQSLLDNPTIEGILPGNISDANSRRPFSAVKRIANMALHQHVYFIFIGIAFMLFSIHLSFSKNQHPK